MSRHAVAYRSLCQGQYERYGEFRPRPASGQYIAPFGLMAPAQMTALTFRRHMHAYGTSITRDYSALSRNKFGMTK